MNFKKTLALILAGILAVGAVAFTSCGDDESGKNKVDVAGSVAEKLGIPAELKGAGNGESFDFFITYNVHDRDFVQEEEVGDDIRDTIFRRNEEVESFFDVDFGVRKGDNDHNTAVPIARSLIQGNDDTYEVFINLQGSGMPLVYEDLFVEWGESMPYVNLDNPWWYQNVNRDLNYNDKVYVAAGAYNFFTLKAACVLTFNKTLMNELDLEYPYSHVHNGTWTVDKFIEYSKAAIKDLNGDGAIDYENDRYGFGSWVYEATPAFYVSLGAESVVKDDNNLPKLNINNERTFKVLDKMIEVFKDGNGAFMNTTAQGYGVSEKMFKEGRLLFCQTVLDDLPSLRNMEDDFGFLPHPKLNEEQENYYSRVVNFASLTYVPITNQKLELTSALLEYMAYLSERDLIPTFYDVILTVKTTRDTDSEEMISIIRNGARFMDENYLTSGTILDMARKGQNTLSSNYAAYGDTWNDKLDDIIDFWKK